jgi:hypothetical protein
VILIYDNLSGLLGFGFIMEQSLTGNKIVCMGLPEIGVQF